MPHRAWLIIRDAATGETLQTIGSRIEGGTISTEVRAGEPGAEVELVQHLVWPDGTVSEDEPEAMTLPEGEWIRMVQMG